MPIGCHLSLLASCRRAGSPRVSAGHRPHLA